jgi:hypothetical protein
MPQKHVNLSRAFAMLLVALCFLPAIFGQTSNVGSVTVTVVDPTGATVPGALLVLRDIETNDTRRAETQSSGIYTFPNLQFGTYELTVTKQGFDNLVFSSVLVQTARLTSITANLKIGGTNQTVTVLKARPRWSSPIRVFSATPSIPSRSSISP